MMWIVWIPEQDGYLLDEGLPPIVTSYQWHAKHWTDKDVAREVARVLGGEVREWE